MDNTIRRLRSLPLIMAMFTSGAKASLTYDAALGTLPQVQSFTYNGDNGNPAPQVSSGALKETVTTGGQSWTGYDSSIDFSKTFTIQFALRIDSSNYLINQGNGSTRSGWYVCARDNAGVPFVIALSSGGFVINQYSNALVSHSLADGGFHTYTFTVVNKLASFAIDGKVLQSSVPPELSIGSCGAPGSLLFGGAAGASRSVTELQYLYAATAADTPPVQPPPVPTTSLVTVQKLYGGNAPPFSVTLSCPSGYQVVAASCYTGTDIVINDQTFPQPPFTPPWTSYLVPSANAATGVYCSLSQGGSAVAQLRCLK